MTATLLPAPTSPVAAAPVTGAGPFASLRVRKLHAWWAAEAQQAGGVPAWGRFDIAAHLDLAPWLFLVQRQADGFVFRLHGEAALAILGHNPKGELAVAGQRRDWGRDLHAYYKQVLASSQAWRCTGPVTLVTGQSARFESVDLPLVRSGQPDTILGLITVVDP